jgi:hypothetical protein
MLLLLLLLVTSLELRIALLGTAHAITCRFTNGPATQLKQGCCSSEVRPACCSELLLTTK